MRTLVDIPEADLALLNKISKKDAVPRAELVCKAISAYLEQHRVVETSDAFGLWAREDRPHEDGMAYQERLRSECERISLFDTTIPIDYLNGVVVAREEIEASADRAISIVTWMEVLVGEVLSTSPSCATF